MLGSSLVQSPRMSSFGRSVYVRLCVCAFVWLVFFGVDKDAQYPHTHVYIHKYVYVYLCTCGELFCSLPPVLLKSVSFPVWC